MKAINFTLAALALFFGLAACNKTEPENTDNPDNNVPNQTEETDYSYDETTGTYTVFTANGLLAWNEAVQDNLSLNCTLDANIDLTNIDYEWLLVGNYDNQYTGTFDGGDHTITGLTVNQSESDYVGLIGTLGSGGKVLNLTLDKVSITGSDYVGGMVGYNFGIVTDCSVSGSVSGTYYVGGVVGYNSGGTVADCSVSGSVSGSSSVGGVVGRNISNGTVTDCSASSNVSRGSNVGGVVGLNFSIVTDCSASGNVSGTYYVGGVVGQNTSSGTVTACHHVSGSVSGSGSYAGRSNVGGVVGYNGGIVTACSTSGSVSGNYYNVGGVVGYSDGTVTACYHISGSVSGSRSYVGGVVGYNLSGTVTACYHASGSVSGSNNVGGVVGWNTGDGTMTACYWSDYEGNGIGGNFSGTVETTKVDGTDVTWEDAVEGMNAAIDTWNTNNSDGQCEWKYELTGDLPTLTKNE